MVIFRIRAALAGVALIGRAVLIKGTRTSMRVIKGMGLIKGQCLFNVRRLSEEI